MLGLRRMHYGAWIGIVVILMSAFAPMISQTLAARRFLGTHQTSFTEIFQATPLCLFHAAPSPHATKNVTPAAPTAMSAMAMMSMPDAMPMQHSKLTRATTQQHDGPNHHEGHDDQEACGYCNLFAHSPLLLNTLLQITSATLTHHAFIAAMGAAFRPYTVAAASRPQPPPLM